jgi:hypothetical protein
MAQGISISRVLQIQNLVFIGLLFLLSVVSAISWAAGTRILMINIIQLYWAIPTYTLFILIAHKFGQRLIVQSTETQDGDLIIRGISSDDTVQFVIELPPAYNRTETVASATSTNNLAHSTEKMSLYDDHLSWNILAVKDAETLQIASQFMAATSGKPQKKRLSAMSNVYQRDQPSVRLSRGLSVSSLQQILGAKGNSFIQNQSPGQKKKPSAEGNRWVYDVSRQS